jgi:hypothetical protein
MGYFVYLRELRQARDEFGPDAADFQVALDLAFADELAKKNRPKA